MRLQLCILAIAPLTAVASWFHGWTADSLEEEADKEMRKLYAAQGGFYDLIFRPRFGYILDHAGEPFEAYLDDEDDSKFLKEAKTATGERQEPPTKSKGLKPRSSYTFICPTSVQCNDGGCCPIGDYSAIRDGSLGCCPIGSLCDASPIPGCSVYSPERFEFVDGRSCYGICCDIIQDLIGEKICSPTPGDGGQASGVCTGVEPTSPLFTPPSGNCNLAAEL